MCHIYFMSTAMASCSGFRVHAVIFHHASVPSKITASISIQKKHSLCCICVFCNFGESRLGNIKQMWNETQQCHSEEEGKEK